MIWIFKYWHCRKPKTLFYYNGNYEWKLVHWFGPLFYLERLSYLDADDPCDAESTDGNMLRRTSVFEDQK